MNTQKQISKRATSLQTKILAENKTNEFSKIIFDYEINQIKPLFGTNPLKIDGSFKAKVNHKILNIENLKFKEYGFNWFLSVHYWFERSGGNLGINIKTCLNGGSEEENQHVIYTNKYIYISKIENGILEPSQYDNNFNFIDIEEVQKISKIAKEKAEEYKKIVDSLPYVLLNILQVKRLEY
jgi:hypothetical protein